VRLASGSWRWTAPTRQDRRRQGKSGPLDAVSAARAAQSGRARGAPKGRDGAAGAIRALMVAKRSTRAERTQTISQARSLIVTGPGDIRIRFAKHATDALVAGLASLRPRPGEVAGYATRIALRELGRRATFPGSQPGRPGELIVALVTARAPGLPGLYGVGPDTAAMLLVAAGDHPGRLRSEAAWAHLCATAPIPASSGKTVRHRPQPRRRPAGQPRPVADRHHRDELAPADPRLRAAAHQGRPAGEGDHPLPQALRRPRGLPHLRPGAG
jgi:transposase